MTREDRWTQVYLHFMAASENSGQATDTRQTLAAAAADSALRAIAKRFPARARAFVKLTDMKGVALFLDPTAPLTAVGRSFDYPECSLIQTQSGQAFEVRGTPAEVMAALNGQRGTDAPRGEP
jgi:hypothetical protein